MRKILDWVQARVRRGGRHAHAITLLRDASCGRILEIGCYHGSFLSRLPGTSSLIVGVNPDVNVLAHCSQYYAEGEWVAALGENLPFKDAAFDSVVMLEVLEHVSSEKQVISEVARVLKPEGCLILSTPHRGPFAWLDVLNFKIYFPRVYQAYVRSVGREGTDLSLFRKLHRISAAMDAMTVLRTHSRHIAHRHYSLTQLTTLLKKFQIERILRTGFLIFPLAILVATVLERTLKFNTGWLMKLACIEDSFPFGPLGYNIVLRARRVSGSRSQTE